MKPFLPFTRPSIDAAEHRGGRRRVPLRTARERAESAGVRGGARRVSGFGPSRARDDLGDRRARDGARSRRSRRGRRSHRSGDELCRERECSGAGGGQTRIRRYRSAYRAIIDVDLIERAVTPRTRAIMPVHFSGLPVDMDALSRDRRAAWSAGRRRRGPRDRLAPPRPADRQLRRSGRIQLSSQQEHDQHRGRRHRDRGRRRRRRCSSSTAFTASSATPKARSTCCSPARRAT